MRLLTVSAMPWAAALFVAAMLAASQPTLGEGQDACTSGAATPTQVIAACTADTRHGDTRKNARSGIR